MKKFMVNILIQTIFADLYIRHTSAPELDITHSVTLNMSNNVTLNIDWTYQLIIHSNVTDVIKQLGKTPLRYYTYSIILGQKWLITEHKPSWLVYLIV